MSNPDDKQLGLYRKYEVRKLVYGQRWQPEGLSGENGRWVRSITYKDPGPCFVMEFDDPHARAAIAAYADSCAEDYPQLAADLRAELDRLAQ